MSKESFNDKIQNMILNKKDNDLLTAINIGVNTDILYEALRNVYLIAYNAKRFKDKDGKIGAAFQFADIDNASISFNNLVSEFVNFKYSKSDAIEQSLYIIENFYTIAASNSERSSNSGMVENSNRNYNFGVVGTYYVFDEIPQDTLEEIKSDFKKRCI